MKNHLTRYVIFMTLFFVLISVLAFAQPAVPNTTYVQTYGCGSTTVTRQTSPPSAHDWYWQTSPTGTSTSLGNGNSVVRTSTANLYLRAKLKTSNTWSTSSQSVGSVTIYTTAPAAPSSSTGISIFANESAVLSVSAVSGATSYKWYSASSGGTLEGTSTTNSFTTAPLTVTKTFYVSALSGGCESSSRRAVTATVEPLPQIQAIGNQSLGMGGSVTLKVTGPYLTYSWRNASNVQVGTQDTYTTSTAGTYKVIITKSGISGTGAPTFVVGYGPSGQNQNYIVSNTLQIGNITTLAGVNPLSPDQKSQSTQYFDGLGRPMQTVVTQGSPSKLDIVQPVVYDHVGREARKYLPFTAQSDGWYKPNNQIIDGSGNYAGIAQPFYLPGSNNQIADDTHPFAETRFEASPLSRVIEQGAPGNTWQPDNIDSYASNTDRTIKFAYQSNEASEVLVWTYTPPDATYILGKVNTGTGSTPAYYPANQLYKTFTKDEQFNEVIEFKDKNGKVILKKVQASSSQWAQTYYIYDDLDNLVCVIPPQATSLLATQYYQSGATDVTKNAFLNRWAFRYRYDERKRMIVKQVPGADPVYMVYDKRDRLVLTQDGNQRAASPKQWTFTKYDQFNRPIATGIKDTTATLTQSDMQGVVNTFYAKAWTSLGETYIGTTAGNVHGYTNKSYPVRTTAALTDPEKYLSVTYYDNYSFKTLWTGNYNYENDNLSNTPASGSVYTQPTAENLAVLTQVTGTKVKVLDGGVTGGYTWLKSVNYYDDKYRVIQNKSDNYKGGIDRISNLYDFVGKVLKTKSTHTENDVTWKDMVSVQQSGNILTSTSSTSGAASVQQLPAGTNGWLEVIYSEGNTTRFIGLNDSNPDAGSANIDYAFRFTTSNTVNVYENNTVKATVTGVLPGDVFRIERTGTAVKYYRNGTQITLSPASTASSTLLMADASFAAAGSTLVGVRSSFGSATKTITRTFTYDHAGRLTHTWHQLDGGTNILLAKNEYNELGQLIDKKLHSTVAAATDNKQSVDYRYNIRGWLTSMNNASLTTDATNDDATDYFGMNLSYNTVDTDLTNAQLYNGNISAIKWSNYGDGTVKQKGYTYTYDEMNRILSSTFKEKTTSWATLSSSRFAETGFTYDLNGNIKTLTRNDKRASGTMDILTYNYGSGTTLSNKLLSVTDGGDDFTGFIDDTAADANDYTYDANGNMTRDLNKGIGTSLSDNTNKITYNFLNLPETVTKGGNTIRYIYDATGRKLAQAVTMGAQTRQTDYAGEFMYENDVLQFINHEEGRIVTSSAKLLYVNSGEAVTDFTASNATLAPVTQNGTEKYVKATSNGTVARTGVFPVGGTFSVVAGERYKIRMKGYRTGTSAANLLIKAGGNDLSWPGVAVPLNAATESWIEQIVTIPAGATTLEAGAVWATVTSGEVLYINEFEISKLETTTPEYQYNLKDHLGNVRLTFTTKQETESATATLETANANAESGKFINYAEAIKVNHAIWDHTNTGATKYATRLTGANTNAIYGLAKSLSVMPGDVVNMQVYAKYLDTNNANWTTALNNFITSIANGTAPVGTLVDGGAAGSLGAGASPISPINHAAETGTPPKAYLNYIVFNKDMTTVLNSGFSRITTNSREYGQDCAHDLLSLTYTVKEPGYIYIYLSNENATAVEVYFDDFKVDHIKSPVLQMDDYYAFGLTFNSFQRENILVQQLKFNGIETQDELDLQAGFAFYRMYDPFIARWWGIDPKPRQDLSPYVAMANNPTLYSDPLGDTTMIYSTQGKHIITLTDTHDNQAHFINGSYKRRKGESMNAFAARIRKSSVAFIGQNTIKDVQNIVQEANNGVEIGFTGMISDTREIRLDKLSVNGNRENETDMQNQLDDKYGLNGQASIFLFGHVHHKKLLSMNASEKFRESELATPTISKTTGRPVDYYETLRDTRGLTRSSPGMIATPYGLTIYPSIPPFQEYPSSYSYIRYSFFKAEKVK